jgi:hypothetical protein
MLMRRLASLAATAALLSGCQFASNPTVGFGGFISDTHLFKSNPNLPVGSAENIRRVQGQQVAVEPLGPEPGNIWPGPPKAEPTLEDMIRQDQPDQSQPLVPPGPGPSPIDPYGSTAHPQPRPANPPGSSGMPGSVQYQSSPTTQSAPQTAPAPITVPPATVDTSKGPQVLNRNSNGVTTTTSPGGGTSIVVPNGNGTSTIINPDGSTQTIPTPH